MKKKAQPKRIHMSVKGLIFRKYINYYNLIIRKQAIKTMAKNFEKNNVSEKKMYEWSKSP